MESRFVKSFINVKNLIRLIYYSLSKSLNAQHGLL